MTILPGYNDDRDFISVHTPARGVTPYDAVTKIIDGQISIHTPARGVTEDTIGNLPSFVFQSTLPQGE